MSMIIENNQIVYGASTYGKKNVSNIEKNSVETLEEYKGRILQEINKIPFHSSHKKIKETLVISEEGYQAMKDDPEYEKWVLEHIRENRSVNMSIMTNRKDYISGTDYEYIGATKEECWGKGYNEWNSSKNSSGSSAKGKKELNIFNDSTNYIELWEQAREKRAFVQEERNKEYFSHKRELVQMNAKLVEKCYNKNFLFETI